MLTVLIPVTRPWTMDAVVAAIAASDIPREHLILILDAPGCEAWEQAITDIGFSVELHGTGNADPLAGRIERRPRHLAMRRLSQTLVPDGPLLCLEDDTLVPPNVYAMLTAAGPNATGIQVGRHKTRKPGVRGARTRTGIAPVTSCGHYCLLTTGEAYRSAPIPDTGPVDTGHTSGISPLMANWECVCGHLTEGGVLYP